MLRKRPQGGKPFNPIQIPLHGSEKLCSGVDLPIDAGTCGRWIDYRCERCKRCRARRERLLSASWNQELDASGWSQWTAEDWADAIYGGLVVIGKEELDRG